MKSVAVIEKEYLLLEKFRYGLKGNKDKAIAFGAIQAIFWMTGQTTTKPSSLASLALSLQRGKNAIHSSRPSARRMRRKASRQTLR